MNATSAIKSYNTVSIESEIIGADPHKLIALLYQGALLGISNAKNGILRKDIVAKGASITKTIAIIGEGLNASLDKKIGARWRKIYLRYTTIWSFAWLLPIWKMISLL